MTLHTLKPDTQTPYVGNEDAYNEWYEKELHLSPAQVRLDQHTYNDETGEVTFLVRPTNAKVTALAKTPPPWATVNKKGKPVADGASAVSDEDGEIAVTGAPVTEIQNAQTETPNAAEATGNTEVKKAADQELTQDQIDANVDADAKAVERTKEETEPGPKTNKSKAGKVAEEADSK